MNQPSLRAGSFAAISLCALAAVAAPKPAKVKETARKNVVVLVVPFAVDEEAGQATGFAAAELITDLFAQDNVGAWLSSKQLDAALRRKDLQLYDASDLEVALPLARTLGATDLILGQLVDGEKSITLTASRYAVRSGKATRTESVTGTADQLPALAAQLGRKLLDISAKAQPMTSNAKALAAAGSCWQELVRYPLQPRAGNPAPLDNAAAIKAFCDDALKSNPTLGWAHAGSAILKSLGGDAAGALAEVQAWQKKVRFEPWLAIAGYFAARQSGDEAGARKALETAAKARPGFLAVQSYLAEARMEAEDYKGAVAAWEQFLKHSPDNPYALGQKAKALGYLHKDRDALSFTRRALDIDPGDPELLIELGSRQLDAKQNSDAEASFRQAMEARPPRPLAWLRLGWLYIRENKPKDAHDTLIEGVTYAYREDEARTRAGLFADLALVAGMQNHLGEAVQYLNQAKAEGYGKLPCDAEQLKPFHGKLDFDSVCPAK